MNRNKKILNGEKENDFCFKIIALGGDAKSRIKEAMVKIKEKNFSDATRLLEEADKNITKARNIQHKLLTKEIRDKDVTPSILLNHAMDILITAESEFSIVSFIYPYMMESEGKKSKEA